MAGSPSSFKLSYKDCQPIMKGEIVTFVLSCCRKLCASLYWAGATGGLALCAGLGRGWRFGMLAMEVVEVERPAVKFSFFNILVAHHAPPWLPCLLQGPESVSYNVYSWCLAYTIQELLYIAILPAYHEGSCRKSIQYEIYTLVPYTLSASVL